MKNQYQVGGLGELLWDCFPDGRTLGGAPTNFACHVHQLGERGFPISCLGSDELGQAARAELETRGVSAEFLFEHANLPTGTVEVTLDDSGKPTYKILEEVAWDEIPSPEGLLKAAAELDAVCFGTLCQRSQSSRKSVRTILQAMSTDSWKILDVNLRQPFFNKTIVTESLALANALKLSDEELPVLAEYYGIGGNTRTQVRELMERFELRLVAFTMGGDGSEVFTADDHIVAEAVPTEMVSSVGAGDSFTAALCVGLLHQFSLSDCGRFANQVAAYVCSQQGACPPLTDELRTTLESLKKK